MTVNSSTPSAQGRYTRPSNNVFQPTQDGNLERVLSPGRTKDRDIGETFSQPERAAVHAAIKAFISNSVYPCVGAKSALHSNAYRMGFYDQIAHPSAVVESTQDVQWFVDSLETIDSRFATFLAVFHGPAPSDETNFSEQFWRHLSGMVALDQASNNWDCGVSSEPESPDFALSIGACAVFVVGMHPAASRLARRFPLTMIVFNAHSQFAALRSEGNFEKLRDVIRDRDKKFQGVGNPMLADHGTTSEAAQYDGLSHPLDWVAPIDVAPARAVCPVSSDPKACPMSSDSEQSEVQE